MRWASTKQRRATAYAPCPAATRRGNVRHEASHARPPGPVPHEVEDQARVNSFRHRAPRQTPPPGHNSDQAIPIRLRAGQEDRLAALARLGEGPRVPPTPGLLHQEEAPREGRKGAPVGLQGGDIGREDVLARPPSGPANRQEQNNYEHTRKRPGPARNRSDPLPLSACRALSVDPSCIAHAIVFVPPTAIVTCVMSSCVSN